VLGVEHASVGEVVEPGGTQVPVDESGGEGVEVVEHRSGRVQVDRAGPHAGDALGRDHP
jgi:hypothetical protein